MKSRSIRSLVPVMALAFSCPLAFAADGPEVTGKKVNINQASAEQLALLPRVGAKSADRILAYRKANGPFRRPEELMEVKGIGEKLFFQLKPYVTVSGPTTLSSKLKASTSKKSASSSVPLGKGR